MSRNADRLKEDSNLVRDAAKGHNDNVKVYEIPVDLAEPDHVKESLQKVDKALEGTPVEFVLFNAARTGGSAFFDFEPEAFTNDLKIAIVGLYTVARWAIPKLQHAAALESKNVPSLVATSGLLAKDPSPKVFSLAACKGGQLNLLHSLHKEFEPQGVHVAAILIGGTVAKESEVTNPRNIAEEAFKIFETPKGKGEVEVLLKDPAFEEHVKMRNNLK